MLICLSLICICFCTTNASSLLSININHDEITQPEGCPCDNPAWCMPITNTNRPEIFIFRLNDDNSWQSYNWSLVTTVALFTPPNTQLMCTAHQYGARVVTTAFISADQLTNATYRTQWINDILSTISNNFLDGVNVDFEDAVAQNSPQRDLLTQLMKDLRSAMNQYGTNLQLTFDVAWSPNCIDGRCYDYLSLAEVSDFVFMMDYDMQSQIFPPRACQAYANAPFTWIVSATHTFLDLGIPAEKIVMGVPWYGYDYPCLSPSNITTCPIKPVPFRGASCSDAAGTEIPYAQVMNLLQNNATTTRLWDAEALAPYFNYINQQTGQQHQVRYDDVESLTNKFLFAKQLGLRGAGMWNADCLDYSDNPLAKQQTQAMWNALSLAL